MVILHGPQGAWIRVRDRRQDALESLHWLDDAEVRTRNRYWHGVAREIENQTGYQHETDAGEPVE